MTDLPTIVDPPGCICEPRSCKALVSIVLLNWNSGGLGAAAARSAQEQCYPHIELIVVDNGSTDDSLAAICSTVPEVHVVTLSRNVGYARGMNQGFAASTGTHVLFLNCDAVLHPAYIQEAINAFESEPNIGMVGGLTLRASAAELRSSSLSRGAWAGRYQVDAGPVALLPRMSVAPTPNLDQPSDTFKPNGSCPVVSRTLLEDIASEQSDPGPFATIFESYGEDIDMAFRAHALGWKARYSPTALALHQRGYSTGRRVSDKRGHYRRLLIRSRYINCLRNLQWGSAVISIALAVISDVVFTLISIVRGDIRAVTDVGAAIRWVIRRSPEIIAGRLHPLSWRSLWLNVEWRRRTLPVVELTEERSASASDVRS